MSLSVGKDVRMEWNPLLLEKRENGVDSEKEKPGKSRQENWGGGGRNGTGNERKKAMGVSAQCFY